MHAPDFITSDLHLGHENILKYQENRRAWGAVDMASHDNAIIEAWNAVVGPEDWVLVLGDFTLAPATIANGYRRALNGKIALVLGNHDRGPVSMKGAGFDEVCRGCDFTFEKQVVCCRHDPKSFNTADVNSYDVLLHGHYHGNSHHDMKDVVAGVMDKALDVGIDCWSTPTPRRIGEVMARWRAAH
jgi:calcineurin-like phosphoesterase family protein